MLFIGDVKDGQCLVFVEKKLRGHKTHKKWTGLKCINLVKDVEGESASIIEH